MKKLKITSKGIVRACFLLLLLLAGAKGFINSRNPVLNSLEVELKNLPPAFNGIKVGQITDIHAGPLVPESLVREGVDIIMSCRPDLIVLTGDFVSGATRFLWTSYGGFKQHHFDFCMEELGRLEAPLGVFAVLGNHDFWSGSEVALKIVRGLEDIGVRVLRNEAVPLERKGQKLYLMGVDDYWEESYDLLKALEDVPQDTCRILLSHNPDVNENIENLNERIDLIISGHTHGGQVVLPVIGPLYIPSPFGRKYLAGPVMDKERITYVSRGLGVFFVPVRINSPADVSLLKLVRE